MKLTAQVKLLPNPDQAIALLQTLEIANDACNIISQKAWNTHSFRQFPLHHLTYQTIRDIFPLTAQVVVRCIAKVADAYKVDHKVMRVFRPHGAIAYDNRILSWKLDESEVSIWTIAGRTRIPFVCGERQRKLLVGMRGESDLCIHEGSFYLSTSCEVKVPEPKPVTEALGVDLGIVNIASDSDGIIYSGDVVETKRRIYSHRRRNLQRKKTKAAKRKLKKISGKQARYQKDTNHLISKRLVQKAQDTGRAIAMEDLGGIRDRVTVRGRKQRARHANWSFHQLRQYISYKAELAGIPVIFVDPRNTSRTCPICGCVDKRNRVTQSLFSCVSCSYSAPADTNAAVNISARAVVNQPMVSNHNGSGTSHSH
ncbi:MAG: transposase [Anaerolineaceae bacterium]|jgi:IS605 OrfB family transposase